MLGMGDMSGLLEKVQEVQQMQDPKKQQAMLEKIEQGGVFSLRDWREQVGNLRNM